MGRNIFGWSLPPGVTMADIEKAYGEERDPLDDFTTFCKKLPGFLSEDEEEVLTGIQEDPEGDLRGLISKLVGWAYNQGYQQGASDEAEGHHCNGEDPEYDDLED